MKIHLVLYIVVIVIIGIVIFNYIGSPHYKNPYEIKYLIGVSQCNLGEPWRIKMNDDISKASEKYEDLRVIFTDASQDNQKQIEDVKTLLNLGIDLLIISPNEAEPLTDIVREAYQQVPVILLDRSIIGDDYTLFIGADNYEIGKRAGEYVTYLFPDKPIHIVEIRGLLGSPPAIERSQGFYDAIKDAHNISIQTSLVANWLRDDAELRFFDHLSQHSYQKIDLVFAHNDPMAYGAYKASQSIGRKDIVFIGIDGLYGKEGGIPLVEENILTSTFIYPTGGQEAIEYSMKILKEEYIADKRICLKSEQVTRDNIQHYIKD